MTFTSIFNIPFSLFSFSWFFTSSNSSLLLEESTLKRSYDILFYFYFTFRIPWFFSGNFLLTFPWNFHFGMLYILLQKARKSKIPAIPSQTEIQVNFYYILPHSSSLVKNKRNTKIIQFNKYILQVLLSVFYSSYRVIRTYCSMNTVKHSRYFSLLLRFLL